jgi:hypothetical protein
MAKHGTYYVGLYMWAGMWFETAEHGTRDAAEAEARRESSIYTISTLHYPPFRPAIARVHA